MNKTLISSLAILTIIGLATLGYNHINTLQSTLNLTRNLQSPATVPYVDIDKYAGSWYEQSVIPFYFERGCTKTVAKYSWNTDKKSVRVDNTCIKNGRLVQSVGKAIPQDSTNAKLKVQFVQTFDIGAQYWIVRLGKNYQYAVVSSPDYHYLWILYRQPHMPEDLYQSIVADLKKDNFPVEKLKRTQQ